MNDRVDSTTPRPRGLVYLLLIQAFERAGHYGLVSVLVLYLIDTASRTANEAYILVGAFTALAALNGVGGGIVADSVLGRGRSIVAGCVLMAAGGFLLSIGHTDLFALSLALIAVGTGLVRPNIPALTGALLHGDDTRRQAAYNLLYVAVNLGGVLGPMAVSLAAVRYGYDIGFVVVAAARLLGLMAYFIGRKSLEGYDRPPDSGGRGHWKLAATMAAVGVVIGLSTLVMTFPDLAAWWVAAVCAIVFAAYLALMVRLDARGRAKLVAHLFVVITAVAFWAIYQQFTLSVVVFTQNDVNRTVLHWLVPASAFNAVNPFFVILFAPVIVVVWRHLAKSNREPSDFLKLGLGFVIAGASFELLRLGVFETAPHTLTPYQWIIAFQAVLALGELMVGPVGLNLTDRLSIPGLSGFFTGVWYLSTAVAYYLSGVLAADLTPQVVSNVLQFEAAFSHFGTIGIAAGVLAIVMSRRLAKVANR